jgi:hypothetical protein
MAFAGTAEHHTPPFRHRKSVEVGEEADVLSSAVTGKKRTNKAIPLEILNFKKSFFRQSLTATVIQVHELIRRGDMTNDIEPTDGLTFCNAVSHDHRGEAPPVQRIFRPATSVVQVFERVVFFDQYSHGK